MRRLEEYDATLSVVDGGDEWGGWGGEGDEGVGEEGGVFRALGEGGERDVGVGPEPRRSRGRRAGSRL